MKKKLAVLFIMILAVGFGCSKAEEPVPVDVQPVSRELPKLNQNYLYKTNIEKPRPAPDFGFQEMDPDSVEPIPEGQEPEVVSD